VLRLNVAFNAAGHLGPNIPGFANFIYTNAGDSLDGMTVNQILLLADQVLAGNAPPPSGYTFDAFGILLEHLSFAFQTCVPSEWAGQHLLFP
jgi:hypothetical protein